MEHIRNWGTESLSDFLKVTQLLVAGQPWGHRLWKTLRQRMERGWRSL